VRYLAHIRESTEHPKTSASYIKTQCDFCKVPARCVTVGNELDRIREEEEMSFATFGAVIWREWRKNYKPWSCPCLDRNWNRAPASRVQIWSVTHDVNIFQCWTYNTSLFLPVWLLKILSQNVYTSNMHNQTGVNVLFVSATILHYTVHTRILLWAQQITSV